ncbi:polysaccharide deacetylase family protein [Anaerocolumna sp. AGMB13025]|uniref:polysaccharide deacetylase family protein n=1 Tax=Anaerocolumna sp. AGMB13025 TaxID=3039116 RepID=UPI00241D9B77|nr:polysaccharide deacetylase family protein [Anaerocolumna sp. AGMB13025]WFR59224.1 polysaccharide deacetylase family protein [Anaerocolumna sp. AGMB13025]
MSKKSVFNLHNLKILLLVITFCLLSISITRNLIDIYAASSNKQLVCVPILMYHQVKNSNLGKDVISPAEFESDLKYLSENNYNTITMSQLIDYVYNGTPLPENPVILSFDDGSISIYKNVFPLLKQYNFKIVLSIVGKSTDDYSKVDDDNINYAVITWDDIYEMDQSGLVEIQNHSYNLHHIRNGRYGCYKKQDESVDQYEEVITEDLNTLQKKVLEVTDKIPTTFTYPYGKYNNLTESIIKKLGFKATLSCTYGVNIVTNDPESLFGLKRICRSHNQPIGKLIQGGMKTIRTKVD